jgi:Fur family ferric uptake transcriptional regulator
MITTRFQRNTKQRKIILQELMRSPCHPTASELHEKVRKKLPRISLGTVYRNLEAMAEMGQIRKLESSGSTSRFDGDLTPHNHVHCLRCGRMDDLHGAFEERVDLKKAERISGYEISRYQLDFSGICPQCKEAEKEKKASP